MGVFFGWTAGPMRSQNDVDTDLCGNSWTDTDGWCFFVDYFSLFTETFPRLDNEDQSWMEWNEFFCRWTPFELVHLDVSAKYGTILRVNRLEWLHFVYLWVVVSQRRHRRLLHHRRQLTEQLRRVPPTILRTRVPIRTLPPTSINSQPVIIGIDPVVAVITIIMLMAFSVRIQHVTADIEPRRQISSRWEQLHLIWISFVTSDSNMTPTIKAPMMILRKRIDAFNTFFLLSVMWPVPCATKLFQVTLSINIFFSVCRNHASITMVCFTHFETLLFQSNMFLSSRRRYIDRR